MARRLIAVAALAALVLGAAFALLPSLLGPSTSLTIVSGSENKALEPIIADWGADNGVAVEVSYLGSVDIARELGRGAEGRFDAVWPANSLWIALGDSARVVRHDESILRSPVVLGLRRSIAERLGWIGRDDITIAMIQEAARADAFRLAMTSATQSNSGASAYIGFLYAQAGNPDLLGMAHLADPAVLAGTSDLLQQIDRSSGSSGWLKDALVANPGAYDAMINYEAIVLEANRALAASGEETLYLVYPADGLAVADSPLGYVDRGDAAREEAFLALKAHLLTPAVQDELLALGRRAGLLGLSAGDADPRVWNPDWGVDLARAITPVPTPPADVIAEALRLYQTELRKPSLTVWILDVSGSMEGEPLAQLKQAMGLILDPEAAALNLLQPSQRDITVILPFSSVPHPPVTVAGGDPAQLSQALSAVQRLRADGGTDLYAAIMRALELLAPAHADGTLFDHLPAIVAMTDGASDTANRQAMLA
ncbi:MAG: substrate-binding domain-containing protein, partial [Pseudomonadota bacterium]